MRAHRLVGVPGAAKVNMADTQIEDDFAARRKTYLGF
jgi:hypothetical protein